MANLFLVFLNLFLGGGVEMKNFFSEVVDNERAVLELKEGIIEYKPLETKVVGKVNGKNIVFIFYMNVNDEYYKKNCIYAIIVLTIMAYYIETESELMSCAKLYENLLDDRCKFASLAPFRDRLSDPDPEWDNFEWLVRIKKGGGERIWEARCVYLGYDEYDEYC